MNTFVELSPAPDETAELIQALIHDLTALADCDLSSALHTPNHGQAAVLHNRLSTMHSNLNDVLRQMVEFASTLREEAQALAGGHEDLAQRIREQTEATATTSASMEELSSTVQSNAEHAQRASVIAAEANQLAQEGRQAMSRMMDSMNAIERNSRRIEGAAQIINDIAFQTKILSLNAAVEAARAGEHGRTFAVVANEVRNLAQRCADATGEIRGILETSTQDVSAGQAMAHEVDGRMRKIAEGVAESSRLIADISNATHEQSAGIRHANAALSRIDALARDNQNLIVELADTTADMKLRTEFLDDAARVFKLSDDPMRHPQHRRLLGVCEQAAADIGKVLEAAIRSRQASLDDLFDEDYQPIPNTRPQKFHTRFDTLTDKLFPAVQEPIVEGVSGVVYAGAVDRNGYFPTHNLRFSKPLTGDPKLDLAQNRTKRLFDDRVGFLCGYSTDPYRLQAYRRDTGELMFDLSVPIVVEGRHWGGFRIGYRIT